MYVQLYIRTYVLTEEICFIVIDLVVTSLGDLGAVVVQPMVIHHHRLVATAGSGHFPQLLHLLYVILDGAGQVATLKAQRLLHDVAQKRQARLERALDRLQLGEDRRVVWNKGQSKHDDVAVSRCGDDF